MRVRLTVADKHLPSLQDWLRRQDALRGRVRREMSPPAPGDLFTLAELAVSVPKTAVPAAARALAAWLAPRHDVTLVVRDERGDPLVELPAGRVQDPERALLAGLSRAAAPR